MNVLVTGGLGYIGSLAVHEIMYRYSPNFVRVFDKGDFSSFNDVTGPEFKKAIKESDIIVHLASVVGYPACDADPNLAKKTNIGGMEELVEWAGDRPIIFPSTQSVYDGRMMGKTLCTEDSVVYPTSLYAETKVQSEYLLKDSAAIIFRFMSGFGVSPKMRDDVLVNNLCKIAVQGSSRLAEGQGVLDIYQPEAKRSFIHVRDMGNLIAFAVENWHVMVGETYNAGSVNITKGDLAKQIQKVTGCGLTLRSGEDQEKRDYFVSYTKLEETGWAPTVTLNQGIEELTRYYAH